jgi:hypothetical protein
LAFAHPAAARPLQTWRISFATFAVKALDRKDREGGLEIRKLKIGCRSEKYPPT